MLQLLTNLASFTERWACDQVRCDKQNQPCMQTGSWIIELQPCGCHPSKQIWTIREEIWGAVFMAICVSPPDIYLSFVSMFFNGLMKKISYILSFTCTISVHGLTPPCFLLSVIQISKENIMENQPGFVQCSCPCLWIRPQDNVNQWRSPWTHRVLMTHASKASNLFTY